MCGTGCGRVRFLLQSDADMRAVHARVTIAVVLAVAVAAPLARDAEARPRDPRRMAAQVEQPAVARARQLYDRAVSLDAQGNASAALALLWEASGLSPRDAEIQNSLGESLDRIGALDAAADAYRRALAARPSFNKAANNLVLALAKSGRGREAVARATDGVASAPDDPERLFTLGLAQNEQDVEAAVATFHRVLAIAPAHGLARYNLALALQRADRSDEALAELERLVAVERRPEALYTMGIIYWHRGEPDRAVTPLRAAVAARPRYADAYEALGAVEQQRGNGRAAAAALREAARLRPDLPGPRYALGRVLRSAGRVEEAERELTVADNLRRQSARVHEALTLTSVGIAAMNSGELTRAVECFRRAIAASDIFAPAHYQLGLALQQLGMPREARAAFDRAESLNSGLVPPPRLE